ncbi:uncharacterized protein Z518_03954 [Rhinocladiella mackenziei CBS 650.93]|uniref:Rhinocladiella mackenziei CBS 650.93 unplaced genomic scaffold supercont1.3, whole genome shotgun sequence n=1 Tax=Rhinocladiella mackenziei CBS 650.93 TaxID=1442369 RepID=A0A0D2JA37_9EURO|nr:uncharacterized protein Z518_03954 [Rhinocladiella mackenziei CBS 650.93]KIX05980.1 hypothetical protein Z518_03954 [Rhinocladiella mackenziei CBS 650.93]
MSTIALETPLAEALSSAVHSKIVEEGWTQEDDTSLAEYIVLMLANGKTQDQIASELAGELLQDAKGTTEFAQWLFDQVNILSSGATGAVPAETLQLSAQGSQAAAPESASSESAQNGNSSIPAAYEMDMADNAPENAPRGPKGLHGGRPAGRGGRGGANNKSGDSVLHRVRGNDRISTHSSVRGVPKGPRNIQNRDVRPGLQKALNGMGMSGPAQGMQNPMMMNGAQPAQGMMQMTPQQQMEFMAMMEQQTRMLAQFTGMMPSGASGASGFAQAGNQQQNGQGRSLFDRVEPGRGRGGARGRGRGGNNQNGHTKSPVKPGDNDTSMEGDGQVTTTDGPSMDVEPTAETKTNDPSRTMCHFNLRCTNKDCPYVHQSPAAPEGTVVDMSDTCSFGVACKNPKCVGKHPSPAQVKAFQAQELCKYFPNCTKPNCPFKHPNMPVCRFGANCKTPNCQFTHLQIPCRFNPCTNMRCPYKHEPGQQKLASFADYSWTPDKQTEQDAAKGHVSDRKFVDEQAGEEELIKPEGTSTETNGNMGMREEVIT